MKSWGKWVKWILLSPFWILGGILTLIGYLAVKGYKSLINGAKRADIE